jgi:hypothetical protein
MKAIIQIGYTDYIMDVAGAIKLSEVLASAERYKSKGYGDTAAYFVWSEPDKHTHQQLTLVSDDIYRMARLAGKPTE